MGRHRLVHVFWLLGELHLRLRRVLVIFSLGVLIGLAAIPPAARASTDPAVVTLHE